MDLIKMNTKSVLKKELLIYFEILLFLTSVKERCPDHSCASDYVVDAIKDRQQIYSSFFCTKEGFIYHNTTVVTSCTGDVI